MKPMIDVFHIYVGLLINSVFVFEYIRSGIEESLVHVIRTKRSEINVISRNTLNRNTEIESNPIFDGRKCRHDIKFGLHLIYFSCFSISNLFRFSFIKNAFSFKRFFRGGVHASRTCR